MKKFCVTHSNVVYSDTTIKAENEKEAKKKFKEVLPYDKIEEVWEVQNDETN